MAEHDLLIRDLGLVRELTLSHPARRNALNDELLGRLAEELLRAAAQKVRCLVIRGEGELAFSSGYDLNALPEIAAAPEPLPDHRLEQTLDLLDRLAIPVIAFLNGAVFGGALELAARCDLRVAVAGIKLGMPPARLGVVYAPRGLARFLALLGPAGARRLLFTGEPIDAEAALTLGLVDEVLPRELAEARVLALAAQIAENAPLAVQGMKQILQQLEHTLLQGLDVSAAAELRREAFASDDLREGRAAFLEKRPPRFTGR